MRSPNRKVIEVSKPLHDWLTKTKEEDEARLGRQVTFSEIIERLRVKAEAA